MTTPFTDPPSDEALLAIDDEELMEEGEEVDMGQVIHRPDGYHWVGPDGTQEFGPFESMELALADMQSADEENAEPGETLEEAENELGVADWVDPDTGELAEGLSTPRLHGE
jgi:hypothetical protein